MERAIRVGLVTQGNQNPGSKAEHIVIAEIENTAPFFIVGCGRSGTSLLRSQLNRHSRIAIPLESLFIIDYLGAQERYSLDNLKAYLVREPEIAEWGLQITVGDLDGCETMAESIARVHEIYAHKYDKDVWGQKTPRFVRHLPLLANEFPEARFIHLIRDPRAVANSLIQSNVHRSDAYHAALRWKRDVRCGLAFARERPERMLELRYETLVTDPIRSLEQVLEFLDLAPDALESSPDKASGADEYSDFYANIHANLDQSPTADFIDKWERTLLPREVEIVEAVCGDMMQELGYSPRSESPSLRGSDVRNMKLRRAYRTILQAGRYLRYRRRYLFHLIWRKWKLGRLKEFIWNANY